MKKAAKATVTVLVVAAVAWSGASWYMGKRVEQELRAYVEQLDGRTLPWRVSITRYDRGWFSSDVALNLSIRDFPLQGILEPGDVVPIQSRVHHGPLPLARLGRGEFAPVLAAMDTRLQDDGLARKWFAAAKGAQPLEDRSAFNFAGEVFGTTTFAPLQFEDEGVTIGTEGGTLDYRVAGDASTLAANATLGNIRIKTQAVPGAAETIPADLLIEDTSLAVDYRKGRFDIHLGKANVRMGRITLDSVDEEGQPLTLVMQDYVLDSQVGEDEQNLNARVDYSIGSTRVMNMNLGQMAATLRVGNLDGEAMRGIIARYREIEPQLLREVQAMPPESDQIPPLLAEFLDQSLQALLPGRPAFGVDPARWTLPGGESSVRLNVTLREPPADSEDDYLRRVHSLDGSLVISRGMMLDLIKTAAHASGAPPATDERLQAEAESTYAFLRQMALSTGYLVQEGDNLVMRLSYADGQIRLNGEQSSLEELLRSLPM